MRRGTVIHPAGRGGGGADIAGSAAGAGERLLQTHAYLFGVGHAQRQIIAVEQKFYGIAHGGTLYGRDPRTGNEPHIEKMLPQGALAAHLGDDGGPAHGHLVQRLNFHALHRASSFAVRSGTWITRQG